MPRQKNETATQTTLEVVEPQDSDVTVEVPQITTNAETTEDTEKQSKSRKPRVTILSKKSSLSWTADALVLRQCPLLTGLLHQVSCLTRLCAK